MKTKLTLLLMLSCLLLVAVSCKRERLLGLSNGVLFQTSGNNLSSPITINIVNANPSGKPVPNGVFVDLLGEGADQLYSLGGEKDGLVTNGFINLGLYDTGDPGDDGTGGVDPGEPPVRFSIHTEVEGFLPSVNFADIPDPDLKQVITVQLVDEDDLPPGVSKVEAWVSAPNGEVAERNILITPLENGKEDELEMQILQGTGFETAGGAALSGDLEVQLVHYDSRAFVSRQLVAAMSEGVEAFDIGGEPLGRVHLYSAGLHQLEVWQGFGKAASLSQPALMRMELNPQTLHAQTQQYLQEGDPIQIWHLDITNRVWVQKDQANIQEEDGVYFVEFEQSTTGTYTVATAQPVCETGAQLTLRTGIAPGSCTRPFYVELVDMANDIPISFSWSDAYYELYDGVQLRLTDVPQNTVGKLRIWEGIERCKGALLTESNPIQLCGGDVELSLADIEQSLVAVSDISVSGFCANNGTQEVLWPTTDVLYRPAGCGYYGFLGSLQDGMGCLGALQPGDQYDLRFQVGGEAFDFKQVTIQTSIISTPFQGTAEPALLTLQVDGGQVEMNIQGLPLDPICQQ
jgi:hypothetical protein